MKYPRRISRSGGRSKSCAGRFAPSPPATGRSWKSAAGRRTRSSSMGSTSCCPAKSSWFTGRAARSASRRWNWSTRRSRSPRGRESSSARSATCCACREAGTICSRVKAAGGDVRIVYSPLDCLKIARQNPTRTVVFFAVGFETTCPANAMAVWQARRQGTREFRRVGFARAGAAGDCRDSLVAGQSGAGFSGRRPRLHGRRLGRIRRRWPSDFGFRSWLRVSSRSICSRGFIAAWRCWKRGAGVENQYARVVRRQGNPPARQLIDEVFEVSDRKWRGVGTIPQSGLRLRPEFADFDAERRFAITELEVLESTECISGLILQGIRKPHECPAFGKTCTPERPLGATMVSSEGACAAYYHFGRHRPRPADEPVAASSS